MAIARQDAQSVYAGTSLQTTAATGDAIIAVICDTASNASMTVSDGDGAYTMITEVGSGTSYVRVGYRLNATSGLKTVSLSGAFGGDGAWYILRYSGMATSSPVDQTPVHSTFSEADAFNSGNITTSVEGDLLLGVLTDINGNKTFTETTGLFSTVIQQATHESEIWDQLGASQGTHAFAGTMVAASGGVALLSFKAAGGGAATPITTTLSDSLIYN
jgi:hypothetical protein